MTAKTIKTKTKPFVCNSHHRRNKKTHGYQCAACKQRGAREERAKIVKAIHAMIHELRAWHRTNDSQSHRGWHLLRKQGYERILRVVRLACQAPS